MPNRTLVNVLLHGRIDLKRSLYLSIFLFETHIFTWTYSAMCPRWKYFEYNRTLYIPAIFWGPINSVKYSWSPLHLLKVYLMEWKEQSWAYSNIIGSANFKVYSWEIFLIEVIVRLVKSQLFCFIHYFSSAENGLTYSLITHLNENSLI